MLDHSAERASPKVAAAAPPSALRPHWNPGTRELWLGDRLVKRFHKPAPRQECILAAFEKLNWPEYIVNPLPHCRSKRRRQSRLHDAIEALKDNQQERGSASTSTAPATSSGKSSRNKTEQVIVRRFRRVTQIQKKNTGTLILNLRPSA